MEVKTKDINCPVYPSSPKPSRGERVYVGGGGFNGDETQKKFVPVMYSGGKDWRSDNRNFGDWGPDTFRKWIPVRALRMLQAKEHSVTHREAC